MTRFFGPLWNRLFHHLPSSKFVPDPTLPGPQETPHQCEQRGHLWWIRFTTGDASEIPFPNHRLDGDKTRFLNKKMGFQLPNLPQLVGWFYDRKVGGFHLLGGWWAPSRLVSILSYSMVIVGTSPISNGVVKHPFQNGLSLHGLEMGVTKYLEL